MDDSALRRRVDAALALSAANFALLLVLAFRYATEAAVGVLALVALVALALLRE